MYIHVTLLQDSINGETRYCGWHSKQNTDSFTINSERNPCPGISNYNPSHYIDHWHQGIVRVISDWWGWFSVVIRIRRRHENDQEVTSRIAVPLLLCLLVLCTAIYQQYIRLYWCQLPYLRCVCVCICYSYYVFV